MEALKRARRPVRREFENYLKELKTLLTEDPIDKEKINVKFKLFMIVYENLNSHDSAIAAQMTVDHVEAIDEDQEYDEVRELNFRGESLRQQIETLLMTNQTTFAESVTGGSNNMEARVRSFKLPPVQLKKFNGEIKDWLGFWAQFQKIHEDPQLTGSDKYFYLLQSIEPNTDAHEIVGGYPSSNENYDVVIEALRKQYGNEDMLLQVYIREILSLVISNVNSKDKLPMKNLFLRLDSHLRALKTLRLEKADPQTWLFPLVESCLPETILYNWQRSSSSTHDGSQDDPPKSRLDMLMSFVEKEVEIRQRIDLTRRFANQQKGETIQRKSNVDEKRSERRNVPTLSSFYNSDRKVCVFCDKVNHESGECYHAKAMAPEVKMKILREKGLCFRCTGKHLANTCRTSLRCGSCQGQHLTTLCRGGVVDEKREPLNSSARGSRFSRSGYGVKRRYSHDANGSGGGSLMKKPTIEKEQLPVKVTNSNSNVECVSDVALQTLLVRVNYQGKSRVVRAFMDTGSQRSYILKSTVENLGLKPVAVERVVHSLFGGQTTKAVTHNKYEVELSSLNRDYVNTFKIRDSENICGAMPIISHNYPNILEELKQNDVHLSDVGEGEKKIELLIGADVYAEILTAKIAKLRCGAAAVYTELGWTLLGNVANSEREDVSSLCINMAIQDANIAKLWELDVIGVEDPNTERTEKHRLELEVAKFIKNISRRDDGRYIVKLPWKNNLPCLPSNRPVAYKRLQSASMKIKDSKLFPIYDSIFRDWENEGFIERVSVECDAAVIHYLPHRPVIKDSMTTPVRPVFDASCRVGKAPSLNECLFTGENNVKAIPDLLLRFREKAIAFISDIRKAFQMIEVDAADRDAMRFLWWNDEKMDKLVEFRHARVMFGATCSPFILGAVLQHHLTHLPEEKKEIGAKLLASLYVDNCVSSEHSNQEYLSFREESTELLRSAKMDLRLWLSNVDEFEDVNTHVVSVLGLQWDRKKDEIFVAVNKVTIPVKISKRTVLSAVQKIYDPIGFTSPALLPMKLLLQRAWIHRLKWDDELPKTEKDAFSKWCDEIEDLGKIRLPRLTTAGVIDRTKWSLHIFTDASKDAYSAVIFLRVEREETVKVQLLAAKSRVAPIKPMTIPKLELMGCLIGKRLAETVKNSLQIHDVKEQFWCDSTTALAWIRRDPDFWGTFVSNRTREIRDGAAAEKWRYVPGILNPADLPSRGCLPSKLLTSVWWKGPAWLSESEDNWPMTNELLDENEIMSERKKTVAVTMELSNLTLLEALKSKYPFSKQIGILAWVRRFLFNKFIKNHENRRKGPLIMMELHQAELILVRNIQRESFPQDERGKLNGLVITTDDWGILRVTTRLTYRDDPINFKYPMLLPRKGDAVEQLILEMHRNYCHAGVGFLVTKLRQKYWVLKARHTVKKVISKCQRCRRFSAKAVVPESAPLPLDRVKNTEVFEIIGVDLAGPLILKNGEKVWIVIFTCAVYRAVHFELVNSVSTRAFIKALEIFVEKYRRPSIIYSDNGTNFCGANNLFKKIDWKELGKHENTSKIKWKFNPPTSSWWGGWWERLIRTAKDLLRRTIGKQCVNLSELKSLLKNIAEVMNGRPLTYVSEDPSDLEPLTPALFLHPFGSISFPETHTIESKQLRFRYNYVATLKKELRERFLNEYISMLVNKHPKKATRELVVGELVFVGFDNLKRIEWPLGRVIELIPGRDGVVRVARVKTQRGEITRSVQRLFPLEMDSQPEMEKDLREKVVRRSGRRVSKPLRFL